MEIFGRLAWLLQRWPLWVLAGAFGLGVILWGGFNWAMVLTNTESFCISCHEMRNNVFKEYKKTVHDSNGSGVRATCPDCHVPRNWWPMTVRKVSSTNELLGAILGSINTREKFLDKRWSLAETVWTNMQKTDSRECRNCHSKQSMDLNKQSRVARERHLNARQSGKTCIDCHKGIAHELPEAFIDAEHDRIEKEEIPCVDCHAGMWQPPTGEQDY